MPFPPRIENPYVIMQKFFTGHEHCVLSRMADADEVGLPIPQRPDAPALMWQRIVREQARQHAIMWLWGIVPGCRTIHRLTETAKVHADQLNPYVVEAERREFRQEFLWEVQSRVEMIIATGRK